MLVLVGFEATTLEGGNIDLRLHLATSAESRYRVATLAIAMARHDARSLAQLLLKSAAPLQ
jgi:hypothetical protein